MIFQMNSVYPIPNQIPPPPPKAPRDPPKRRSPPPQSDSAPAAKRDRKEIKRDIQDDSNFKKTIPAEKKTEEVLAANSLKKDAQDRDDAKEDAKKPRALSE